MEEPGTITGWLEQARDGDDEAFSQVIIEVYDDLRRLASIQLRKSGSVGTLQTTGLANDAVIRLLKAKSVKAKNRKQFYALVVEVIHHAFVDEVRAAMTQKRRPHKPVAYYSFHVEEEVFTLDLLVLDDALKELELHDAESMQVILQRFYAGRSLRGTSEVLGWTMAKTVKNWKYARAWLLERIGPE
ncbi:hypothetical protein COB72_01220 [bacterium]|nr:MAG: hypothetical protein COB72_01220 [bacterium]